jgi:protein-S-isoprenylcysteine O-methyltransferase Ste14
MTSADSHDQPREAIDRGHLLGYLLSVPAYFALFIFLPAGTWAWTKGWLFLGVMLVAGIVVSVFLWRVNPDVVAARSRAFKVAKRWDKLLLWFFLPAAYAIIPVAALDDGRFHWFPLPGWVSGVGYGLFLVGMAGLTWAEAVNKFFEPTVRIQTERGHKVIDTGPYAFIRHPGYVAGILIFLGIPLCLASLWALIPAGLASLGILLRTAWEDNMLQKELPGYKEYTQRVRYKMIPGVW